MSISSFQSLIQSFFTDRLQTQLGASQYTIAAYRDTFRLLLQFASERIKRAPSELRMGTSILPSWGSSSNTSSSIVATALGRETTDCPRYTPSSST